MKHIILISGVLLVGCEKKAAENPSAQPQSKAGPREIVRQLAQEFAAATINGDFERIADLTHDTALEYLGGREWIEEMKKEWQKMKERGMSLKSADAGEPGEFINDGGTTFVVLPTEAEMEMTTPPLKLIDKGYLLGISSDGGKSWKFIDGTQMEIAGDEIMPLLPKALKLPQLESPEIINKEN